MSVNVHGIEMVTIQVPAAVAKHLKFGLSAVVDVAGAHTISVPDGVIVEREGDTTTFYLNADETQSGGDRLEHLLQACKERGLSILDVQVDYVATLGKHEKSIRAAYDTSSVVAPQSQAA